MEKRKYNNEKNDRIKEYNKNHRSEINAYKNAMKSNLMITCFTNKTFEENRTFCKTNDYQGCIYGSPLLVSNSIARNKNLMILEMNNDENKIMGIGLVKNIEYYKKYKIYNEDNYNRYTYMGIYHINRNELSDEEETIMKIFDILCFKGNRHMKRVIGIKSFPPDILYRCSKVIDLVDFVRNMFLSRINNKNNK
jgi:hypothetical protein